MSASEGRRTIGFTIDSYLTTLGGRDGLTHKVIDRHVHQDLGKNTVNYDRDPLLFFPYVSLPKDLCPPGRTPLQAINEIFESVVKTGLYDEKLEKWAISENAPAEKVVPEFFNKILLTAYSGAEACPTHTEWREHSTTLIEGTRKPDVILVPSRAPEPITFREVYSYCELKSAFTKNLTEHALFQLTEIAGYAVAAQLNRRFFVASSLCGSMLTLGFFARGSVVFSKPFDVHKFPILFLTILIGLSSADHTWNGIDHAMRPCGPPNSFTIFQVGHLRGVTLRNLLLYASSAMQSRGTKVPLCKASLGTMTGPELYCVLKLSWLPTDHSTDIEINQFLNTRTPRQLTKDEHGVFGPKDEYYVFHGCMEPTTVEYTQWDDVHHLPGIPIVVDWARMMADNPEANDNLREEGYYSADRQPRLCLDTTTNILARFDVPRRNSEGDIIRVPVGKDKEGKPVMGPVPLYQEPRQYIGVVSRTCGAPLIWFSCRRELVNGLMGGLIAHFNGLRKEILHCDISDANLWYRVESPDVEHVVPEWPTEPGAHPKRAGMLGDWGYAEDLRILAEERRGRITGTFPFMASELLSSDGRNGKVVHQVHHDLESFFWVLWIICVNMDGPYYTRRIWQDEREDLTREGLSSPHESGTAARRSASRSAAKPPTPAAPALCTQLPPTPAFPPSSVAKPPTTIVTIRQQDTRRIPDTATRLPSDDGSQPPIWATPGVHECGVGDVSEWKRSIPTPWFYDCLSPYFRSAGQGFQDGFMELRDHFAQGTKKAPITHATFLRILRDMRDSIPADTDRPSHKEIKEARVRYETLLRVGGIQGIAISALDGLKRRVPVNNSASAKRQAETSISGSANKKLRSSGY